MMNNIGAEFWDNRYSSSEEYIYGREPNDFFKDELKKLRPGKLFLPAEGEGRNAVYAAKLGWAVDAVDFSSEAKNKALAFSKKENVAINYLVADLMLFTPNLLTYDAAGIIFLHMDQISTKEFAQKIINCLKPRGTLIMEVYSKNQLGKSSGGPQNSDLLYSIDEIKSYYESLNIIHLAEENVFLDESKFHSGEGSVIRMTAQK